MQKVQKTCITNANWEKIARQIDAKNRNLHCQLKNEKHLCCQCKKYKKFALPTQKFKNLTCKCKKYKKFALPMSIGKKKLVKSMQKIKKLALPTQKF